MISAVKLFLSKADSMSFVIFIIAVSVEKPGL